MALESSASPCFWDGLDAFGNAPALIEEDGGRIWTYRELRQEVAIGRDRLHRLRSKLLFLFAGNDAGAVLCYLSALAAGLPVYLGNGAWTEAGALLNAYSPDILLWKGDGGDLPPHYQWRGHLFGYNLALRAGEQEPVGDGIALLLSTSGSLGSPKMVRLSGSSIATAASQVVKALHLAPSHRAITSLPMNFVYGLSVIHGHLAAGASVVMTRRSIQDRAFWRLLDETGATSLAGVPWTFGMLRTLSFDPLGHPSLRHLSLSGGAVASELMSWLVGLGKKGISLYSMYGQTEAGGRMAVLPPGMLADKPGSVGFAVDGSRLACDPQGNIVFHGPGVMLGYAQSRQDLTGRDDQGGTLATGDSGYQDADGCLYITGRTSRIAKLFGLRIDLGEVEELLGGSASLAVTCGGETLDIYVEGSRTVEFERRLARLLQRLRIPGHCAQVHVLASLPRNGHGKIQYGALSAAGSGARD